MSKRIMYLRDNNNPQGKGNPIGCLAIEMIDRPSGGTLVNYQVSVLHPTDRFDRKLGQLKALSKLEGSAICADVLFEKDISIHQVSSTVMSHISANKKIPKRARQAARRWLRSAEAMSFLVDLETTTLQMPGFASRN